MDFSVAIRVHTPVGKSSHDGLSSTKAICVANSNYSDTKESASLNAKAAVCVCSRYRKLNAISSNQDVLKDALRSDREKGGLNLIFESCQFKLTEKVS